jgi:hypothetical protein
VKKKLLVLLATLALLVPGGSASAAPQSQTAACSSQQSKLAQRLRSDVVRTEPVVRAGLRGTRVYLSPDSTTVDVFSVGVATAVSPPWTDTNDPDFRQYWYEAEVWVEWIPDALLPPCDATVDGYAFAFNAVCKRYNPVTNARAFSPCNFSVYAALQTQAGATGGFDANWGYKHFTDQRQLSCVGTGGFHYLPDDWGWVRTWVQVGVRFYDPSGSSPLHLSQSRKTTSYHVKSGATALQKGDGTGVFLAGGTAPAASDVSCQ